MPTYVMRMTLQRVRRTLLLIVLAAMASLQSAHATDTGCRTCWSVTSGDSSTVWCDFPPSDAWGYDQCTVTTRQTTRGSVTSCRTGASMCYYLDVQG
jgi:hypothetical protein